LIASNTIFKTPLFMTRPAFIKTVTMVLVSSSMPQFLSVNALSRYSVARSTQFLHANSKRNSFLSLPSCQLSSNANADSLEITNISKNDDKAANTSLYRSEGLFAVYKPVEWTSQDVVSYLRKMLERDARSRGLEVVRVGKRRGNKKLMVRVGHGGTLDPLACGILVVGVGEGTKQLQSYLDGTKAYRASAKLGFETKTLDMEGESIRNAPFSSVTTESIEAVLPSFTGKILQVPPIFSALKKDGKRLYDQARKGVITDDLNIQPREVEVHSLQFLKTNHEGEGLPSFGLEISCGKGTYIRSLVRDIGRAVDSLATMTWLERTQQGPFTVKDVLHREDWSPDNIYAAIDKTSEKMKLKT